MREDMFREARLFYEILKTISMIRASKKGNGKAEQTENGEIFY
jgi:hypothetical protein